RSSFLVLAVASGCSLGNIPQSPCTTSAECRDAFGFAMQCGSEGYCEALDVPDRCTRTYPTDLFTRPEEHADVVVFGTLFDHESDIDNLQSIELAFQQANTEGGLDGLEVGLVSCDYQELTDYDNDPSGVAADTALGWLADDVGVQGVLGPAASQLVLDVWGTAEASGLFVISPSATSNALVTIDGEVSTDDEPGLFWRTAPPDADQAAAIVADIQGRGNTNVAVISQVGAYGDGLASLLQVSMGIPGDRMFTFENSNQLTGAIADVAAVAGLQEVVFISSEGGDVSSFLNGAAVVAAYDTVAIFLSDTARAQSVLQGASVAQGTFTRVRGTSPIPDPATSDVETRFYLAYSQEYGQDANEDGYNAFSYDAAWLSLYGAAWARSQEGGITGLGIAKGLRHVTAGPATDIRSETWEDVQAAFANGDPIDVRGASGELQFDPSSGETSNPIAVWQVRATNDGFENVALCYPAQGCSPIP
ncbi:MAG: ABC transporter substrate-binding protein, partial [Myxococcales bacterium]|nr:ABC transporter substrate-binding protein [Myxococcales bacterium]